MTEQKLEIRTILVDSEVYQEAVRSLLKLIWVATAHPENFPDQTMDEVAIAGFECLNALGVSVEMIEDLVEEEGL